MSCRVYEIRPPQSGAFRKRPIDEESIEFIYRSPADEVHQKIGLLHAPYIVRILLAFLYVFT